MERFCGDHTRPWGCVELVEGDSSSGCCVEGSIKEPQSSHLRSAEAITCTFSSLTQEPRLKFVHSLTLEVLPLMLEVLPLTLCNMRGVPSIPDVLRCLVKGVLSDPVDKMLVGLPTSTWIPSS